MIVWKQMRLSYRLLHVGARLKPKAMTDTCNISNKCIYIYIYCTDVHNTDDINQKYVHLRIICTVCSMYIIHVLEILYLLLCTNWCYCYHVLYPPRLMRPITSNGHFDTPTALGTWGTLDTIRTRAAFPYIRNISHTRHTVHTTHAKHVRHIRNTRNIRHITAGTYKNVTRRQTTKHCTSNAKAYDHEMKCIFKV